MTLTDLVRAEPSGALLVSLATAYLVYLVVVAQLNPLKKCPGPWYTLYSKMPILVIFWRDSRNRYVQALHEKYGPIVRLGPDEVSICDPKDVSKVYLGNFDKSRFYAQFGNYGAPNLFCILTKEPHIKLRKLMTGFYRKETINGTGIIQEKVDEMETVVAANNKQDVHTLFRYLAFDVVTRLTISDSEMLAGRNQKLVFYHEMQTSMTFWTTLQPKWWDLAAALSERQTVLGEKTSISEASQRCNDWTFQQTGDPDTLLDMLKSKGVSHKIAMSEVQDHIAAGHETTAVTLAFLFHRLAHDKSVQDKLYAELEPINVTLESVDSLPYLNGLINETLRLHAAIPGAEPRVCPAGVIFQNVALPKGTIISAQPYTLHRDKAWGDPEEFRVERWSEDPPLAYFMPFGAGIRMCIGMNVAMGELKLATAQLVKKYEIKKSSPQQQFPTMKDSYTTLPEGDNTLLFEQRAT